MYCFTRKLSFRISAVNARNFNLEKFRVVSLTFSSWINATRLFAASIINVRLWNLVLWVNRHSIIGHKFQNCKVGYVTAVAYSRDRFCCRISLKSGSSLGSNNFHSSQNYLASPVILQSNQLLPEHQDNSFLSLMLVLKEMRDFFTSLGFQRLESRLFLTLNSFFLCFLNYNISSRLLKPLFVPLRYLIACYNVPLAIRWNPLASFFSTSNSFIY